MELWTTKELQRNHREITESPSAPCGGGRGGDTIGGDAERRAHNHIHTCMHSCMYTRPHGHTYTTTRSRTTCYCYLRAKEQNLLLLMHRHQLEASAQGSEQNLFAIRDAQG